MNPLCIYRNVPTEEKILKILQSQLGAACVVFYWTIPTGHVWYDGQYTVAAEYNVQMIATTNRVVKNLHSMVYHNGTVADSIYCIMVDVFALDYQKTYHRTLTTHLINQTIRGVRNPLNTILASSPPAGELAVACGELANGVFNLVDFYKLIHKQPVVRREICSVVDLLDACTVQIPCRVDPTVPKFVQLDIRRVLYMIDTLIARAQQYGVCSMSVEAVYCDVYAEDGQPAGPLQLMLVFSVYDSGTEAPNIRIDELSNLSVSALLAKYLKGDLCVVRAETSGTTITLTIPATCVDEVQFTRSMMALKNKSVLVYAAPDSIRTLLENYRMACVYFSTIEEYQMYPSDVSTVVVCGGSDEVIQAFRGKYVINVGIQSAHAQANCTEESLVGALVSRFTTPSGPVAVRCNEYVAEVIREKFPIDDSPTCCVVELNDSTESVIAAYKKDHPACKFIGVSETQRYCNVATLEDVYYAPYTGLLEKIAEINSTR